MPRTTNSHSKGLMERTLFDAIPNEVSKLLISFSDSIKGICDTISAYRAAVKTSKTELPAMRRIQTELCLAYAMNALFFVYLRCSGVDTKDHPILKELDRLTGFLKRCQSLCNKQGTTSTNPRLNKEASSRFVKRALWQSFQPKAKKRKHDNDM